MCVSSKHTVRAILLAFGGIISVVVVTARRHFIRKKKK